MGMSFSHLLLLLVIVLVVFGAGKLPLIMGDLAKGVRAFKDGLKDIKEQEDDKKILVDHSKKHDQDAA